MRKRDRSVCKEAQENVAIDPWKHKTEHLCGPCSIPTTSGSIIEGKERLIVAALVLMTHDNHGNCTSARGHFELARP